MMRYRTDRIGAGRTELFLALAVLTLLFQLFPATWFGMIWALDVRNWPRTVWFVGNLAVLFALFGIRFGPQLFIDWRERRARLTIDREKQLKQQELKERRQNIERMQQARSRRVY